MASNQDPLTVRVPEGHLTHGQLRHALLLAALLPGAWAIAAPALGNGAWLGVEDLTWLLLGLAVPIVHQVMVVLVWRGQLCHGLMTRAFGDRGLHIWVAMFFPFLLSRPLLMIAMGLSDGGSLPIPEWLGFGAGGLLLLPAVWAGVSVKRYFGPLRAVGGDHFFERYRTMPMVREGAFRFSSNAMYTFIFLGFWGIALMTRSRGALALALFQHAYIWVHWYCTEQPDGVVLYGRSPDEIDTEAAE